MNELLDILKIKKEQLPKIAQPTKVIFPIKTEYSETRSE